MTTFLKRAEKEMRHFQLQMQQMAGRSPTFTQQLQQEWDETLDTDELRKSAKHLNQHLGDVLTKVKNNPNLIMEELQKGWKKFVEEAEEFTKDVTVFVKKNLPKDISDLCKKALSFLNEIVKSLKSLFEPKEAKAEHKEKSDVSHKHHRDEHHGQDKPHAPQVKKPRKK